MGEVMVYGPDGAPVVPNKSKPHALAGGYSSRAYDAADVSSPHLADWHPVLGSPDSDVGYDRDRIVARVRDLVRNDGWASGAVTRILDNAVGAKFRPVAKPDYRALRFMTGIKGFDAVWADEFGRAAEASWRIFANDPSRYCDVTRHMNMPQLFRLAFRHKLIDGDALALLRWMPTRVGRGKARFATAVHVIDPDRLSNPMNLLDNENMRGGVEIDEDGAAIAYHIRAAHPGDWYSAGKALTWDRIPRETEWGRPVIVHDFDHDRGDGHRGGAGILAPAVKRLKMLSKYDDTELDAAIINAIFAAYIKSPYDQEMVEGALGGDEESGLGAYQNMRGDFHAERRLKLGSAQIPHLFPGEEINTVSAARPNSNFRDFEGAVLRNISAATGISAQQLSQDWSEVNYSSARASLLEAWKTISRRRDDFATGFSTPIYAALLEEVMAYGDLPLPSGAPDFEEYRAAYASCRWLGPGRGWVDPVAEKKGAIIGMEAGLSTLEAECAENVGEDWEDILDQRLIETRRFEQLGLPKPSSWLVSGDEKRKGD